MLGKGGLRSLYRCSRKETIEPGSSVTNPPVDDPREPPGVSRDPLLSFEKDMSSEREEEPAVF